VESLADQLITEVDNRIEQHLDSYLGKAQEINRTNVDAFESGVLDLNDFNALGKYFYRQVRSFNFAYVNFGTKEGGFIGAGYGLGNKFDIGEIPISDQSKSLSYSVDNQGNRLKLVATLKNPQYNNAAWYLDAAKAGKPIWSSIYTWANVPGRICISASTPVYDPQKKLLGVLGIDLELSQISEFLKKHRTLILCSLSLLIAVGTGSYTANWIAKPILRLSRASQAMSKGVWQESLSEDITIAELKVLATSFNQMSTQVKKAFQESETKFSTIFHTTPDPVWIATLAEGKFLNVNESFCQFWGDTPENILGKTSVQLGLWKNIESLHHFKERLINEGSILNFKLVICTHSQQTKTVLISAKVQYLGEQDCLIGIIRDVSDLYDELRLRKKTEIALHKSEAMLLEAQQLAHIGNWDYDVITGKITWSTQLFQILGRDQTLGEPTYEEILRLYYPQDAEQLHQAVERSLSTGESYQLELRVVKADGSFQYTEARGKAELNAQGQVIRLFGTTQDITERRQVEDQLRASQHFIEKITELTPNLLYIYDHIEQRNVYINRSVAETLGYSATAIQSMGANLFPIICHPDDLYLVYQSMQQLHSLQDREFVEIEYRVKNAQGQWCWLYSRDMVFSRTADGRLKQTLGTSQDISKRKEVELALREAEYNLRLANQELEKLVNIDGLTQIANRRCFDHRLEQEWQRLYREQEFLSLLLFDVDYFKRYNDAYGHLLGDECLIKIAQSVQQVIFRPADLLARYGGEEFVVILPNTDIDGTMVIAQRIHTAIQDLAIPHQASKVSNIVTISIGISSLIPTSELSPSNLIEQADQALYRAKQQGRNQSGL
jgi:diguanylate cyclase (GGDEF)-like protein/PAS domain S-box-containing protein